MASLTLQSAQDFMRRAVKVGLHHCPCCKHAQLLWFAVLQCVKNATSRMTLATEPRQVSQSVLFKLTISCSSPLLQRFSPTWFICRKGF